MLKTGLCGLKPPDRRSWCPQWGKLGRTAFDSCHSPDRSGLPTSIAAASASFCGVGRPRGLQGRPLKKRNQSVGVDFIVTRSNAAQFIFINFEEHLEERDLRSVLFLTRPNPGDLVGDHRRDRHQNAVRRGFYDESRWRRINAHHFRIRSQYFRLLQQSTLHWSCLVDCLIIWAATDVRLSEWSWAARVNSRKSRNLWNGCQPLSQM